METKTCNICGETKPPDKFKKDKRAYDGRDGRCKECAGNKDREYRNRPEIRKKIADYRKATQQKRHEYGDKYKGRYDWSTYGETVRAWHKRNPNARHAYKMLHNAIGKSDMPKASACICVQCGCNATEYHHHNGYDPGHELDVIPLCHSCHKLTHGAYS